MYKPMFVPPRDNALIRGVANALLPSFSQSIGNIRDVRIAPESLEIAREAASNRVIFSPNHPTGNDPIVMIWISKLLGQPFNYLAAREVFVGVKGWFLNQLGAYSVIRGVPDRESLRATRKLLAEQDRRLVIFPEGEIYEYNDTLLVFQSGVAQIGFWTLDDLEKRGKKPELPIVPVAIKYRCSDVPRLAIEKSLDALESALDLDGSAKMRMYPRLLRVGDKVLTSLERQEGLKPQPDGELNPRITAVRQKVMERVAHAIGTEIQAGQSPADQLHHLYFDLKSWVGLLPPDHSDYDERLYEQRMDIAEPLFKDLTRLQNFIAVTGDYVAAEATAERFLDVLGRLEKEVLGVIRHNVPREALVKIAPPIRLEEHYQAYQTKKREAVANVTRSMEETIRAMLRELSQESTPISVDT